MHSARSVIRCSKKSAVFIKLAEFPRRLAEISGTSPTFSRRGRRTSAQLLSVFTAPRKFVGEVPFCCSQWEVLIWKSEGRCDDVTHRLSPAKLRFAERIVGAVIKVKVTLNIFCSEPNYSDASVHSKRRKLFDGFLFTKPNDAGCDR